MSASGSPCKRWPDRTPQWRHNKFEKKNSGEGMQNSSHKRMLASSSEPPIPRRKTDDASLMKLKGRHEAYSKETYRERRGATTYGCGVSVVHEEF